jgi:hypothetical protein
MKRLGSDSLRNGRLGGFAKGRSARSAAMDISARVEGAELVSLASGIAARRDARSTAATKRDRGARDAEASRAAIARMLASRSDKAQALSPRASPPKKKNRPSAVARASEALATVPRGAKVVVSVRGAYNASTNQYDFNGEEGAPHSIVGIGRQILAGNLKLSHLRAKNHGVPYATMQRWCRDDKKARELQKVRGGVAGKPHWLVELEQRNRRSLDRAGAPTVLAQPARTLIAHEVIKQKKAGTPLEKAEVLQAVRAACIETGAQNRRTGGLYDCTTRVDDQVSRILRDANDAYGAGIGERKGQGMSLQRAQALSFDALTKNVERVRPLLREFQEKYGKVSLLQVGNFDETFVDLCKYGNGVFLCPNDGVSCQVVVPFERSPHITLFVTVLGGRIQRLLVGIIGADGIAPHPFHLQCVKDKNRVGLWQSQNGWVTNDAKRAALEWRTLRTPARSN